MAASWDTYLPWFTLREIPGLSNRTCNRLIHQFKTPEALLDAAPGVLANTGLLKSETIRALANAGPYRKQAGAHIQRIRKSGFKIVCLTDPAYPVLLKQIPDPPLVLIHDGSLEPASPCISIVGARKATQYGLDTAEHLACQLSDLGFCVVSGMALGIDTAAHRGALKASGKTWAVLGSGLGHIYPRQNKGLYEQIRIRGAVLSEYVPDTPPLPAYFPQRNRIIAGMSAGTIVVEAAQKSGSLITARLSGEYNREVFAVPGSIRSFKSRGTHNLIRQGAALVETVDDIVQELGQFVHPEPAGPPPDREIEKPSMDKTQSLVYNLLDPYPKHMDEITAAAGLESQQVAAALLDMELSGLILRHPGNYYSKSEE